MASHGRESRIPKKSKKFFRHNKDGHHITTPTAITPVDFASVHSDESVEWEPTTIYMTKKQRDASIKKSRKMKRESVEYPISHPGTDAPKHMLRLELMNCNCYLPESSIDKFGNYHVRVCNNCFMCEFVGRPIDSAKDRSYYDGDVFGGESYDDYDSSYFNSDDD